MSKILDQNEIDALFSKAQASRNAAGSGAPKRVVPCDLRRANQLTEDQIVSVTKLHESFASLLSSSLGAHLRVAFEMNLASVEQMTYKEFLSRLPDLTYLASLRVMPIDARAAIQIDIGLAYPIIDLVLGGSGAGTIDARELTEIEEQVLETIVWVVAQALQTSWAPALDLAFQCEQRQRSIQMASTMLLEERTLCLRFDMRLAEVNGTLSLVFPAVISNVLLRKLSARWSYSDRLPSRDSRRHVRERLQESRFMADLSLPGSRLSIRQFINLEPGQVLMLPKSSREPIHLNIAGQPMFLAYPVRQGARRSARIEKRLSIASSTKKG
ncbi:MAG TPA: FliM/FliN family flagellar motor switch protein [Candidatus Polarisedimenticolia bacterium]|nr:FliM/FliN family flagellar motor switch protein [Candidatus Polarisedimenticolia bacterium]